jgi:hypothetical protein
MVTILFPGFAENVQVLDFPSLFILRLLRNLPAAARQKVPLLSPEDISKMEECKIPVWASYKINRGLFASSEMQCSKGELHFEQLL